jgi:hypothetical protein
LDDRGERNSAGETGFRLDPAGLAAAGAAFAGGGEVPLSRGERGGGQALESPATFFGNRV